MNRRRDLERLVREHQPMIGRICASYESDRELARDLAQDVLLAIWRALPAHRGASSIKTFVARIAQFRAISHVARHSKRPHLTEIDPTLVDVQPLPDAQVIAADERNRLLMAVRRLPLAYREPVVLTLEDFTPPEIAEAIGVTPNVVAIRLSRARTLLRTLLGENDHENR